RSGSAAVRCHCRYPNLVRAAPPLCPDMIFGKDSIETLRQAGAVVDAKAPGDAAAFKGWLRQISQHVAEASKEGGFFGIGGAAAEDQRPHGHEVQRIHSILPSRTSSTWIGARGRPLSTGATVSGANAGPLRTSPAAMRTADG